MIYYYSATGNSRFVARYLGEKLGEKPVDILTAEKSDTAAEGEPVGFVFPIYCWGVPPVVSAFLEKAGKAIPGNSYVWAVCTCGDEAGIAMRIFNRRLTEECGRGADAIFSVIMPNTYVLLPGFDVDKPEVERDKLRKAPEELDRIASVISSRQKEVCDVHEGSLPAMRTRLLFPLFKRWGVFPKYWHAADTCIGCGKCASICPARNINMADRRPHWGPKCFSCCACFHVCPVNAVGYGSITKGKAQYLCPLS